MYHLQYQKCLWLSYSEEYEQAEWEEEKGQDSTEVKIYETDKPGSNEIGDENELLDVEEEHLVDFDGDESYQVISFSTRFADPGRFDPYPTLEKKLDLRCQKNGFERTKHPDPDSDPN